MLPVFAALSGDESNLAEPYFFNKKFKNFNDVREELLASHSAAEQAPPHPEEVVKDYEEFNAEEVVEGVAAMNAGIQSLQQQSEQDDTVLNDQIGERESEREREKENDFPALFESFKEVMHCVSSMQTENLMAMNFDKYKEYTSNLMSLMCLGKREGGSVGDVRKYTTIIGRWIFNKPEKPIAPDRILEIIQRNSM
eukprot:Awhi_evm2s281